VSHQEREPIEEIIRKVRKTVKAKLARLNNSSEVVEETNR